MVHKNVPLFWIDSWNIGADFNNFWYATLGKKLDANDFSFDHLTLILSPHYFVKCKSRSSAIYNNEFILDSARDGSEMINWKATNTIGNYCISRSHTCHITSSLLQHVLKMSSSSTNARGKRWHHSQTAGTTTYISHGSVATVLKWCGQKCSRLRRVSFWCCTPKNY